jgi:uncharacterized glyoxalase superfamily protein PhnB
MPAKDTVATVISCLRYRDAPARAKIVMNIKDEDYGGRGVSCCDLEGHLWNFGTYDPWHQPQA